MNMYMYIYCVCVCVYIYIYIFKEVSGESGSVPNEEPASWKKNVSSYNAIPI